MFRNNKVVWSEGMFLGPHHFQQHDRYMHNLVDQRAAPLSSHPWGITRLQLDEGLLGRGKFALAECAGIFPDGTPFDIPGQDGVCPSLQVPENVNNAIVYLGTPLVRPGGAEVAKAQDAELLSRYVRDELSVADSDADAESTEPQPVPVGRLRHRLLLGDGARLSGTASEKRDACSDYSCVAVGRIRELTAKGSVVLDEEFIPPCLDCSAVPVLQAYIENVHGLLDLKGTELIERLGEAGRGGASEFYNFLGLQVVNRYQPLFEFCTTVGRLHPVNLYTWSLQLAGELSTLTSESRRVASFPPYRHDDLKHSFAAVMGAIHEALTKVVPKVAIDFTLKEEKYGFRYAIIDDRNLLKQAHFVLAVRAQMPDQELRQSLPVQLTIASPQEITRLVEAQTPGMKLYSLDHPPPQIPFHSGYRYFELDPRSSHWAHIAEAGGIAFQLQGDFPGISMTLWAIKE